MALKRTPRPRDPIQLGKLMVDIVTGAVPDAAEDGKDANAVALGRSGGLKGGEARAKSLPSTERKAIAKAAALARWGRDREE
jgi:hypothetical protein